MHTTIDYSKSASPAFDAVEDVKQWFGKRWDIISPEMAKITDCRCFEAYASFAGVEGYPVRAWYELYHGQGSWKAETEG